MGFWEVALLKAPSRSVVRRSKWWYPALLCTLFIAFVSFIWVVQPPFWLRVFLSSLFLIYGVGSFIRQHERATRELERVHEMQSMAERLGGFGSWEYNPETDQATYSSNLYELLGLPPGVVSRSDFMELVHPDDRSLVLQESDAVIAEGRSSTLECRIMRRDGQTRLVRVHAYPDESSGHFFGYLADITDTKPVEAQEALLERMQAVAVLTAGLAHDFNNLLQVMLTGLDLLREETASEEKARLLDDMTATTLEAADLVARLREFAAPQPEAAPEPIVVDDVIYEVLPTLRRAVPADIHLVTRLNASSVCVTGSRSRLRQVIMNLVFNARDASNGAGDITLETRLTPNKDSPGDGLFHLSVTDTGKGLDATTQSHIFEPFFSTKQRGTERGMGLGLAICYSVVADMGGSIEAESVAGQGATFHVYLPAHQRNTDNEDGS